MDLEEETDTKLYSIQEIKNFKAEYIEVGHILLIIPIIVIGYKIHINYFKIIQRNVSCQITVKKVEEKNNWYDNVCSSCEEEVNLVDGRYRCSKCKRNIPYPEKRY